MICGPIINFKNYGAACWNNYSCSCIQMPFFMKTVMPNLLSFSRLNYWPTFSSSISTIPTIPTIPTIKPLLPQYQISKSFVLPEIQNNFSLFNQPYNYFNRNQFKFDKFEVRDTNPIKVNNDNPLSLTDSELTAYGFDTEEKREAFRCLKPKMQRAVIQLTEYAKSEGIQIKYKSKRSIFRTYEEQKAIYASSRKGYAAKPGTSRHETGEAIDITIPGANCNNKNDPKYKKLGRYWQSLGYTWGGIWRHCEPWHFDLRSSA